MPSHAIACGRAETETCADLTGIRGVESANDIMTKMCPVVRCWYVLSDSDSCSSLCVSYRVGWDHGTTVHQMCVRSWRRWIKKIIDQSIHLNRAALRHLLHLPLPEQKYCNPFKLTLILSPVLIWLISSVDLWAPTSVFLSDGYRWNHLVSVARWSETQTQSTQSLDLMSHLMYRSCCTGTGLPLSLTAPMWFTWRPL